MCRINDCDEHSEVWTTKKIKARKQHICTECYRTIMPYERYTEDRLLHSGTWHVYKTCAHCSVGASWLYEQCNGLIFSEVAEEIQEHAEEYKQVYWPLMRFVVAAKRKWRTFDGLSLMAVPSPLPEPKYV